MDIASRVVECKICAALLYFDISKNMKKTFLLTRAKENNEKIAKTLENKGFESIIEPIFSVKILQPDLPKIIPQAIIITSANAALAVILAKLPLDIKIFALGKKSAKKLVTAGYKNIFYAKDAAALSLREKILEELKAKDGNLFYFCSDSITLDFKQSLEPLGFKVDKILSYEINWHINFSAEFLQKITKKPIDFVIFYSQNNAKHFYFLIKKHNLLEYFSTSTLVCLSEKIATELKNLGLQNKTQIFTDNFAWLK